MARPVSSMDRYYNNLNSYRTGRSMPSEACEGRAGRPAINIMHYVYLIRSKRYPEKTYIGNTTNLKQRLAAHNSKSSPHTKLYTPWELITFIGFKEKLKATAFEKYLKTGSGWVFAQRRFW